MSHRIRQVWLGFVPLALLVLTGFARAAPGDETVKSGRYGFAVSAPKGWTVVPTKVEEQWLVAKFLSDKKFTFNDEEGYSYSYQPEMMVIAFVQTPAEPESGEGEEAEVEADEVEGELRVKVAAYKDYEDFLDKTYSGGGFYIDKREDKESGGVPVTMLEIKVEKLVDHPKYLMTWVYLLEGVDVAVQFELLQENWSKLKSTVQKSFKSFKTIERTEEELAEQATWLTFDIMTKGTPEERRKNRVAAELSYREKVRADLPEGWTAEQIGGCFVVSHVDKRHAERLVEQVECVLRWMDETFPFVGPEEYVRAPVLRICASEEEQNSFLRGGDGWSNGGEIVTRHDAQDWGIEKDLKAGTMNRLVVNHWFRDRNWRLFAVMPPWIQVGLWDQISEARAKGKGLDFGRNSDWLKEWKQEWTREIGRDDQFLAPRDLMLMPFESLQGQDTFDKQLQASALVQFFLTGKGSKDSKWKTAFTDYLRHVQDVATEIDEAEQASSDGQPKPKTEEEEEELFRERRSRWREQERKILDTAFERTFGAWTERDWAAFDKQYFESVD